MSKHFVLDKSFASASGVALIRNGEVVEFFPQMSEGKVLGLSGDEMILTAEEEADLTLALEDFVAKMKVIYQRMDESQAEIDRLSAESAQRQKRIETSLRKLEALVQ